MGKAIALVTILGSTISGEEMPAYRIFDADGKRVTYEKMVARMTKAQVVLFGELHGNPLSHWLEQRVLHDLYNKVGSRLIFGAEMFERDQQLLLDELHRGLISRRSFDSQARLWPNYRDDYAPLLDSTVSHQIPFIATNVPRRYAAMVHHKGPESLHQLSTDAKSYFPPLPLQLNVNLNGYRQMAQNSHHGGKYLAEAQALKDATMAHWILSSMREDTLFYHIHGTYHSVDFEGIYWYLKSSDPSLSIVTVHSVFQDSLEALDEEYINSASYIIVTHNGFSGSP